MYEAAIGVSPLLRRSDMAPASPDEAIAAQLEARDAELAAAELAAAELVMKHSERTTHVGLRATVSSDPVLKVLLIGNDDAKLGLASTLTPEEYSLSPNLVARRPSNSLAAGAAYSVEHAVADDEPVTTVDVKGFGTLKLAIADTHGYEDRHLHLEKGLAARDVTMGAAAVVFAFDVADAEAVSFVESTLDWLLADATFERAPRFETPAKTARRRRMASMRVSTLHRRLSFQAGAHALLPARKPIRGGT